ncbi:MAG: hypothetical protein RSB23_04210 [Alistipes sp.]
MKKVHSIFLTLFIVLPTVLSAQVEKQVEVTKAYIPSVEPATKIAIEPDRVDTVQMRPDIDYSITPLSLTTNLVTRPIRPATVTYWEFNRPLPFYVKAGVGYPFNSVFDFYASSQNRSTGYVVGYLNHEGQFAKIKNNFGDKNNSTRMLNRIGAAAGKYLGNHLLEGGLSFENRLYHRYGWSAEADPDAAGAKVNYSDVHIDLRVGDDFTDLSRLNFNVEFHGIYFLDHSSAPEDSDPARQLNVGVSLALARQFGRHTLLLKGGFDRMSGEKAISDYSNNIFSVGLRYGYKSSVVDAEAGVDYLRDNIKAEESANHVIPFAKLRLNLGVKGLTPYFELDGQLQDNSFRSLSRRNPYLPMGLYLPKNTTFHNLRLGVDGRNSSESIVYRLYAGLSIRRNQVYWAVQDQQFVAWQARQTVTSINGEIEYKPISRLELMLGLHGNFYDDDTQLYNGLPSFEGVIKAQYKARTVAFGLSATMQSERKWTVIHTTKLDATPPEIYNVPFTVDLRANVDWYVNSRFTVFVEARNLANQRLYALPFFPDYGINFTAGIKANF